MHTIKCINEAKHSMDYQKLDLNEICETATNSNNKNDVTSLLLFHNNPFLQVLEGKLETLNTLMNKTSADPRHSNLEIIYNNLLEKQYYLN